MTKSSELKKELDQTTTRLNELLEMRTQSRQKLSTLQDGFISGNAKLDAVQSEQAKLHTLESSTDALETRKTQLQDALDHASDAENKEQALKRLKDIADEAFAGASEFNEMRAAFGKVAAEWMDKMAAKSGEFLNKQQEFRSQRALVESKWKGLDVPLELMRLKLDPDASNFAANGNFKQSDCEAPDVVLQLERVIGAQRHARESAAYKVAFEKQRSERARQLQTAA